MTDSAPAVDLAGLTKTFGPVTAVDATLPAKWAITALA